MSINLFEPSPALAGLTPAEAAGVETPFTNWRELAEWQTKRNKDKRWEGKTQAQGPQTEGEEIKKAEGTKDKTELNDVAERPSTADGAELNDVAELLDPQTEGKEAKDAEGTTDNAELNDIAELLDPTYGAELNDAAERPGPAEDAELNDAAERPGPAEDAELNDAAGRPDPEAEAETEASTTDIPQEPEGKEMQTAAEAEKHQLQVEHTLNELSELVHQIEGRRDLLLEQLQDMMDELHSVETTIKLVEARRDKHPA